MFVEITPLGLHIDGSLETPTYHTIDIPIGRTADLLMDQAIPESGYIVWNFLYESDPNLLFDDAYLKILEHGLETFSETLFAEFADRTLFVVLGSFASTFVDEVTFPFTETSFFQAMQSRLALFTYRLAGFEALANRLQQLATALPLELQSTVNILGEMTPSERAYFLSKNVFEHIHPFTDTSHSTSNKGLLLPEVDLLDERVLEALNSFGQPVRYLPENRAVEMWEGLDTLVFFEKYIGPLGKRALLGFEAAGGVTTASDLCQLYDT